MTWKELQEYIEKMNESQKNSNVIDNPLYLFQQDRIFRVEEVNFATNNNCSYLTIDV